MGPAENRTIILKEVFKNILKLIGKRTDGHILLD